MAGNHFRAEARGIERLGVYLNGILPLVRTVDVAVSIGLALLHNQVTAHGPVILALR